MECKDHWLVARKQRTSISFSSRCRPPQLVRQIDPIHDATQPNVCED
jgi:hypothetical protein